MSVVILSFSVQTGHCGSYLAKVCAAPAATGERVEERCERESNSTDYRQCLSPSFSLSPSLCFISMVHTRRPGARLYAGRGRPGAETRGWIDGDGVCGGIKGHAASIAEQVQGLIGSSNGWSM